jgi:hypothetical protein
MVWASSHLFQKRWFLPPEAASPQARVTIEFIKSGVLNRALTSALIRGELSDISTLHAGLSAYRFHIAVHLPVGGEGCG